MDWRGVGAAVALGVSLHGPTSAAQPSAESAAATPPAATPPAAPAARAAEANLDADLQALLAEPGPQAAPDVFGYQAIFIPSTPLDDHWDDLGQADPSALPGAWGGLAARIKGRPMATMADAVNAFVNAHVALATDQEVYGVADHWASLDETIAAGRGDCEDFAIAKMQLLEAAGASSRDLYLLLVRDELREVDHAVLLVRAGDDLLVLDNIDQRVLSARQVHGLKPVVSFSGSARWRYRVISADAVTQTKGAAEP
jgi:predicted transglutaminase-like cysteine proteinase